MRFRVAVSEEIVATRFNIFDAYGQYVGSIWSAGDDASYYYATLIVKVMLIAILTAVFLTIGLIIGLIMLAVRKPAIGVPLLAVVLIFSTVQVVSWRNAQAQQASVGAHTANITSKPSAPTIPAGGFATTPALLAATVPLTTPTSPVSTATATATGQQINQRFTIQSVPPAGSPLNEPKIRAVMGNVDFSIVSISRVNANTVSLNLSIWNHDTSENVEFAFFNPPYMVASSGAKSDPVSVPDSFSLVPGQKMAKALTLRMPDSGSATIYMLTFNSLLTSGGGGFSIVWQPMTVTLP